MTPNPKVVRGDRSGNQLVKGPRLRGAYDGASHDTATSRRRQAAQREAGHAGESSLLTVDQLCAELHISRSTFYDWRAKGKAPECIVLPNGSLRVQRDDLAEWLRKRRAA